MSNNNFKKSETIYKSYTRFFTSIIALLLLGNCAYSQEVEFKKNSLLTGIGLGINQGEIETGNGVVYTIGWQKK